MTLRKHGDIMLTTSPSSIRHDLKTARQAVEDAYQQLSLVRSRYTDAGAVRYDKDRIQSSNRIDLTDAVIAITQAELKFNAATTDYETLLAIFDTYMKAAGFDDKTTAAWTCYYAKGMSITRTAEHLHTTRSHIQYRLGTRAETRFLTASLPA